MRKGIHRRSMKRALVVTMAIGVLVWSAASATQQRPTFREVLKGVENLADFDNDFLNARFPEPAPGRRFVLANIHVNPSAGRLLVFSSDFKLIRALSGWQLAILPGEAIVYHQNQVHFSRGQTLEIAVFDPVTGVDRQIYPPAIPGEIRRQFRARVANAYAAIGEDWFRINNHPMDAERFEAALNGDVTVDERAARFTFGVHFGGQPLTFSEQVLVTCSPLGPVERIECREVARPRRR